MKKNLITILLFLCIVSIIKSQTIETPSIVLSEIEFDVTSENLSDSIHVIEALIYNDEGSSKIKLFVNNGKIDTSIFINEAGNYRIKYLNISHPEEEISVIPGILSIIPPLLAIALALIFRQVVISLLLGIYVGAIIIFDYNPFIAFLRLIDTYIVGALTTTSHIQIIVFTFLFGGVVGLISKSGGTRGIANIVTKFARTRRSGLLSTWLAGLMVFFDDYANSLIVGNLMRPITDKLKISREKLAFIVDATAAPVASIFIVSSWIGYEVGLIQDSLGSIASTENAYDIFIATIPYRFYPIAMLFFVVLISLMRRDFGPMYKAEKRSIIEGKVLRDDAEVSKDLTESSEIFGNEEKARWFNGVVPILVLVFGTVIGLVVTGILSLQEQGIDSYGIRDIIGSSDSYMSLLWASFGACVVAAIMIISQRIMNLAETVDAWFIGVRSMLLALIILTLAWSIGSITVEMKTADYIINLISDTINPRFLPVIVFIACALTSFSTGTSWGTMAIMMPIVIPLAHHVTELYNYDLYNSEIILHGVISSVLTGSVFGDHCSPIADTTILSSMASGCDHMDHVRTQLPYAIAVAIPCMLFGDIATAFGFSPIFSIIIITAILFFVLKFFGKNTYNLDK